METEILYINYLKKVGKKKVTYEKINLELRKKNLLMKETDFEIVIDSPVNTNKLQLRGSDSNNTYFTTTHRGGTIPHTQELDSENSNNENPIHLSNVT